MSEDPTRDFQAVFWATKRAMALLRHKRHDRDRRLVRLFLTERGQALREVIDRERDELSERALASLDPEERAALIRHLDRVRRNLA